MHHSNNPSPAYAAKVLPATGMVGSGQAATAQRAIRPRPIAPRSSIPPNLVTTPLSFTSMASIIGAGPGVTTPTSVTATTTPPPYMGGSERNKPQRRGSVEGRKELRKSRSVTNSPYWGASKLGSVSPKDETAQTVEEMGAVAGVVVQPREVTRVQQEQREQHLQQHALRRPSSWASGLRHQAMEE